MLSSKSIELPITTSNSKMSKYGPRIYSYSAAKIATVLLQKVAPDLIKNKEKCHL